MTGPDGVSRRGLVGLLAAGGISALGTRMSFLALPWFVLSTSGSPTRAGLLAAAELLPYVLVQALGGPLVDRIGPWRASVGTDVVAALAVGAIPLLHATGRLDFASLAVLVAATGALRGAGDAARQVLVPGVGELARTPLERSAGLFDGVERAAALVGAPVAGVLIGLTSAVNVLGIDAATFALSALLVRTLVPRTAQPPPADQLETGGLSYLASLGEGLRYLRGDRLLLGIGVMVLVTNLIDQAGSAVLVPVWAKDIAQSPVALGLAGGAFSLGAVAGNAVSTWLGPRLPRRLVYGLGFLVTGGPRYLTFALASTVSPVLVVSLVSGLGAGGINPIIGAVEYERVPRQLQTRVLGVLGATAWAGIPIGSLAGGALAEGIGVQPALGVAAALYLLTTLAPFVLPVWAEMNRTSGPRAARTAGAIPTE